MEEYSYERLKRKLLKIAGRSNRVMNGFLQKNTDPVLFFKQDYGYKKIEHIKKQILENIFEGRDTLAVMPAGKERFLSHELLAQNTEGLTLIISPFVSLLKQRIQDAKASIQKTAFLTNFLSEDEYIKNILLVKKGDAITVYATPEKILKERIQEFIFYGKRKVSCIAVDEAHCISSLGYNFKREYLLLPLLRKKFSEAAWLALTAAAEGSIRSEIIKRFRMENPSILTA
ncbi:MAG: DEAD/DEAH box helicase [Treponema sp.]|nr:DEAD/DEAH box helicase [Treponema sp.]